jgi:hypothetical protein
MHRSTEHFVHYFTGYTRHAFSQQLLAAKTTHLRQEGKADLPQSEQLLIDLGFLRPSFIEPRT